MYNGEFPADSPPSLDGNGKRHNYQNEFVKLLNLSADNILPSGWRICDNDILGDQVFSPLHRIAARLLNYSTRRRQTGQPRRTYFCQRRPHRERIEQQKLCSYINVARNIVNLTTGTPYYKDQSLTRTESRVAALHVDQSTVFPSIRPDRSSPIISAKYFLQNKNPVLI